MKQQQRWGLGSPFHLPQKDQAPELAGEGHPGHRGARAKAGGGTCWTTQRVVRVTAAPSTGSRLGLASEKQTGKEKRPGAGCADWRCAGRERPDGPAQWPPLLHRTGSAAQQSVERASSPALSRAQRPPPLLTLRNKGPQRPLHGGAAPILHPPPPHQIWILLGHGQVAVWGTEKTQPSYPKVPCQQLGPRAAPSPHLPQQRPREVVPRHPLPLQACPMGPASTGPGSRATGVLLLRKSTCPRASLRGPLLVTPYSRHWDLQGCGGA